MTIWSKVTPEVAPLSCHYLVHPWTESCFQAAASTWLECFVGSAGFFGVLYLFQYLSGVLKKKKKKARVKDILWMHIRSTVFGATLSSSTLAAHCVLRKLLGRYYFISLVFLPAVIGGHSVYMEARKGRELFTNAFANCSLEVWLRFLERSNILKWNPNIQTALFMLLSSALSYLLSSTDFTSSYFWFFTPPRVNKTNEKGVCFHEGDCKKHISKLFLMYSTTGFLLQFLKQLLTNLRTPKSILLSLATPTTFKLGAFLGSYVVLYQAIRCFLYQKEQKYSLAHDSLAGLLAGVAYRFQPTIPVFNSALITVIQILTEVACQKGILPNLPYLEIMFPIFCGVLFHQRLLGDYCPRLTVYFMTGVTHGFTDRIHNRFQVILKDIVAGVDPVKRN